MFCHVLLTSAERLTSFPPWKAQRSDVCWWSLWVGNLFALRFCILDALTFLRVVFLDIVSFSMMDVYRKCQECWEKLVISYHLRGHRSIPLLSLTSCFLWGARASALTSQNGLNQHLMSPTDNTASKTMLMLLLSSLSLCFYSLCLNIRRKTLLSVDVSHVSGLDILLTTSSRPPVVIGPPH